MKILIIEDNLADCLTVERILMKSDKPFDCQHVETLAKALEVLKTCLFDAVLLDMNLPDSSGIEGISKILPYCKYLPVIYITGLVDDSVGYEAIKAGAQDFLSKESLSEKTLIPSILFGIERCKLIKQNTEMLEIIKGLYDNLSAWDKKETVLSISKSISTDIKQPMTLISMAHDKIKQSLTTISLEEEDRFSLMEYLGLIRKSLDRIRDDIKSYMCGMKGSEL